MVWCQRESGVLGRCVGDIVKCDIAVTLGAFMYGVVHLRCGMDATIIGAFLKTWSPSLSYISNACHSFLGRAERLHVNTCAL